MAHSGSPSTDNLQHRLELTNIASSDNSMPSADQSRQLLCNHLDYMEKELSSENSSADIQQIKEMLLQLADVIRSGKPLLMSDQYRRILRRLIAIYARGLARGDKEAFITTAADYADVIEAISQAYPSYDYSEAVGQLLYYMCHQFRGREQSWVTIYHHIVAMPVEIGLDKKKQFLEIRRWAEEGVDQLFQIRQNLYKTLEQLDKEIDQIGQRIDAMSDAATPDAVNAGVPNSDSDHYHAALERAPQAPNDIPNSPVNYKQLYNSKVVDIALARNRRGNRALIGERESLRVQKSAKMELIELIESNIGEFETLLKNTRRAYLLRLV